MAGPLYPQLDPNKYRGRGSKLAGALAKRMFDRPLTSGSLKKDVGQGVSDGYRDTLKPFVDFARKPGISTGASAAIALAPGMLAKSLKLGISPAARRQAAAWNKQVDSRVVPFDRDIRGVLGKVLQDPSKGVREGGYYSIPDFKGEFGAFVDDRTAIIQDPVTGTMFAAPGAIHGELINHVRQAYPQFRKADPRGWMQHEVYAPTDFGAGLDPVPARMMFDLTAPGHRKGDTLRATVARARLMQALAGMGVKQDDGLAKWMESRLKKQGRSNRPLG